MAFFDIYEDFYHLAQHQTEGVDYRIHLQKRDSGVAVVAPHGGKIERGTFSIAQHLAADRHTFYCFEGLKTSLRQNRSLHITSDNFNEPQALNAVASCTQVISIHGARGREQAIYAGGLDGHLKQSVIWALTEAGFIACDDPSPTRQGRGQTNICNRGASGRGLQLEFTFALRRALFALPDSKGVRRALPRFFDMISACQRGIDHARKLQLHN